MEVNILHLYPELMSLYGEWANVAVLRRHLEAMGITVTVQTAACEDAPGFAGAQFIYMGAGTERGQKAALTALLPHRDGLKAALEQGAVALFTGNAMELLGASVTDQRGTEWTALALANFTTVETDRRSPEDVVAHPVLWEGVAVGFMNKCSLTYGVTTPLFDRLSLGFGNERKGGPEGYVEGGLFATHMTGPVLVKNPDFVDCLIGRIFEAQGWKRPEKFPVLPHERQAYEVTCRELSARARI